MKKRLALYSFGQPVFLVVVSVYGLVCAQQQRTCQRAEGDRPFCDVK
jgi:hypothetical protein